MSQLESENSELKKKPTTPPPFFSYENLSSLSILAIIIFAFRWSIVSPYHVPTPSMEPTIKVGDRLFAYKMAYDLKIPFTDINIFSTGEVARGDIIIFRYPKDTSIDYVKRVVGLPGDRIKLLDDVLYINGEPQEIRDHNHDRKILEDITDNPQFKYLQREKFADKEHWVITNVEHFRPLGKGTWPSEDTYYTVPQDSVFVIGDNRDNSADGRKWGSVPRGFIRGKALFVMWSMYTKENSWQPIFRFSRFGTWLN